MLKSDYFRIEMGYVLRVISSGFMLKSDYFRIEEEIPHLLAGINKLKSDYFRIEIG